MQAGAGSGPGHRYSTEAVTVSSQSTHTHLGPVRRSGGVQTRLPWWAVALPAFAFAALLLLMAAPTRTQPHPAEPTIQLIARIAAVLPSFAEHIL